MVRTVSYVIKVVLTTSFKCNVVSEGKHQPGSQYPLSIVSEQGFGQKQARGRSGRLAMNPRTVWNSVITVTSQVDHASVDASSEVTVE